MCHTCAPSAPLDPFSLPPRLTLGRDRVADRLDTFNVRRGRRKKARKAKKRVLILGLISRETAAAAVENLMFGTRDPNGNPSTWFDVLTAQVAYIAMAALDA
jgi:hypothetical protein